MQEEVYAGLGQPGDGVVAAVPREQHAPVAFRKESSDY